MRNIIIKRENQGNDSTMQKHFFRFFFSIKEDNLTLITDKTCNKLKKCFFIKKSDKYPLFLSMIRKFNYFSKLNDFFTFKFFPISSIYETKNYFLIEKAYSTDKIFDFLISTINDFDISYIENECFLEFLISANNANSQLIRLSFIEEYEKFRELFEVLKFY